MIVAMELPKLEPSMRVGDQVFGAIHEAIMSGDLPAGQRLQIRQVAEQLGSSVMPVREAIKRLEEIGLVESQPYRGAVVRSFTTDEVLNLYEVRRLLEVEAATLGAAHATEEDVVRLREIRQQMEQSLNAQRDVDYLNKDEEFLTVIYAASGNPFLLESIDRLWRRCRSYKIFGARQEMKAGQPSELLRHQDDLIAAVEARDSAKAAQITKASLDDATARIRLALPEDSE